MSFFDTKPQTEKTTSFQKKLYLNFDYGNHIVRILSKPVVVYTHYIPSRRAVVTCLGDDCPICKNNKQIMLENPKDFSKDRNWSSRSRRHIFNVLDRTPVKVCPNCQHENKKNISGQYPTICSECEAIISEVKETVSGKVKIANISETNGQLLNGFEASTLDENGNQRGLANFDIMFMVIKNDSKKVTTPVPLAERHDVVEVPEDALYDLNDATLKLTPDEIIHLIKGGTLKDIFAARKVSVPTDATAEMVQSQETASDNVMKLFSDLKFD